MIQDPSLDTWAGKQSSTWWRGKRKVKKRKETGNGRPATGVYVYWGVRRLAIPTTSKAGEELEARTRPTDAHMRRRKREPFNPSFIDRRSVGPGFLHRGANRSSHWVRRTSDRRRASEWRKFLGMFQHNLCCSFDELELHFHTASR